MTGTEPRLRPHRCSLCNRSFARSEHLKRHTTTHTHEKSFHCHCGKAFARRDLLKRHEKIGRHLTDGIISRDRSPLEATLSPSTIDSHAASGTDSILSHRSLDEDGPSSTSVELESEYGEWLSSDAFQNFDSFINTMGLDAPFYYAMPDVLNDRVFNESHQDAAANISRANWPAMSTDPDSVHELKRIPCSWTVTQSHRDSIEANLQAYRSALSEFVLPSALAISRYMAGYMEDFQDHQAIIHIPTNRPHEVPGHPELILAICACGALTRYERRSAIRLFHASKAIIEIRCNRNRMPLIQGRQPESQAPAVDSSAEHDLRIAQAAMLLSTFAIMEGKHELINDATSLNYVLVDFVRDYGTSNSSGSNESQSRWRDWALEESRRRTQCATFNILNMHTMALDSSPGLPSSLLDCFLPCSTPEWTASSEHGWQNARKTAPSVVSFQHAYAALFNTSEPQSYIHSPLGNLTLVSAILQRIYHARQLRQVRNESRDLVAS